MDIVTDPALEVDNTNNDIDASAAPDATPDVSPDPAAADGVSTDPAPYEPNFKFKVMDQEREFDDWAKELVKSPDDEKKYREIMEKVYGIDHIKQDREQLKTQLEEKAAIEQNYNNISRSLDTLTQYVGQGNYTAFFDSLKIPRNEVLQWAAEQVKLAEMDPAQRQQYEQSTMAQKNQVLLSQQNQDYQTQLANLQHNQRMMELDNYLGRDDISQHVQVFDQRVGNSGAFKQAVVERALLHYHQNKQDISVQQAVDEVLKFSGLQTAPGPAQNSQPATPSGPTAPNSSAQPQAPEKKPVIPAVNGSSASVTKPAVKSLDDIRKLRDSRAGANG